MIGGRLWGSKSDRDASCLCLRAEPDMQRIYKGLPPAAPSVVLTSPEPHILAKRYRYTSLSSVLKEHQRLPMIS
jgi:hypothetical protein